MHHLFVIIPIIIQLVNIFLFWLSWPLARQRPAIRWYLATLLIISIWQAVELISRITLFNDQPQVLNYSWRLAHGVIGFLGFFTYRITMEILKARLNLWVQRFFWAWCGGLAGISLFTNVISEGVTEKYWGLDALPGPYYGLLIATTTSFFILNVVLLLRAYWLTKQNGLKRKYLLLVGGFCIAFGIGALTEFLPTLFQTEILPLGSFGMVIFFIITLAVQATEGLIDFRLRDISIRTKILAAYSSIIIGILMTSVIGYYYQRHQAESFRSIIEWDQRVEQQALVSDPAMELEERELLQTFQSGVDERNEIMGVVTVSLLLFGTAMIFFTIRVILYPLSHLREQIKLLSNHSIDLRFDTDRQDEIGSLARAFDHLRKQLKKTFISLEDQVAKKTNQLEQKVALEQRMNEAMVYLLDRSKRTNRLLKKREAELKQANLKLRQVDQIKSDFLSNVSHELRTPLTAIKMYDQLLLDEMLGPVEDKQKEALKTILESSNHLIQIVNDLLDLKKMEAGKLEYHFKLERIGEILNQVKEDLAALLWQSQTELKLVLPADLPAVTLDRQRLVQVLENLVGNAHKFNPDHKPIWLKVSETEDDHRRWVCIAVVDQGIGIKEADVKRLFDKFYQVDAALTRQTQGSGLGLAISKEIVEAHHGRLTVESRYGQGSTFTIWLPLAKT